MSNYYCIDASSVIKMRREYPRDLFEPLWRCLENLIVEKRLYAPREVYREVAAGDDEAEQWAKKSGQMFLELDAEQRDIVREIEVRFPGIIDTEKPGAEADPLLVALTLGRARVDSQSRYFVVTEESPRGPGSRRVPNLCQAFGIPCIKLLDIFRHEGLKLGLVGSS